MSDNTSPDALPTAFSLSLLSVLSFLLYRRNRQLVLSLLEQKRQLFLLTSLVPPSEEERERAGEYESENNDRERDRERECEGERESDENENDDAVSLTSQSSRRSSRSLSLSRSLSHTHISTAVSLSSHTVSHNPYVDEVDPQRCVSHAVKLLQPAPLRAQSHALFQREQQQFLHQRRGRSASEGLVFDPRRAPSLSLPVRERARENGVSTTQDEESEEEQRVHPKTPNFKRPLQFSKSAAFFELYREETPSLSESRAATPSLTLLSPTQPTQPLTQLTQPTQPTQPTTSSHKPRHHATQPTHTTWTSLGLEQPLVIAMVGLPARGKSYLVKMLTRYLKWTGFESKVFNVGNYRRKVGLAAANSEFFDAKNESNQKIREHLAMTVQEAMYAWLHERTVRERDRERGTTPGSPTRSHTPTPSHTPRTTTHTTHTPTHTTTHTLTGEATAAVGTESGGGGGGGKCRVAIFDATNTTKDRRLALQQRARQENVLLLFVESICDDEEVLQRNYSLKLKNDDYQGVDPEVAMRDFLSRVRAYEKVYETIDDVEDAGNISYIKLINVGQKVITRNCHGYLPSQVAFYLQNVHILPRKIYLSVVAEGIEAISYEARVAGSESGELTAQGEEYVQNLADFVAYESKFELTALGKEVVVLTGTGNIHYQSVTAMKDHDFKCYHTALLNELRGGDLHGYSRAEIRELFPQEFEKRGADKLNYRYPGVGGESYVDVMERLRPVIIELERQRRSVVVVCHIAVLRCIYAYFMGVPLSEMPNKNFEYHRIYELNPGPFGCACSVIQPNAQ